MKRDWALIVKAIDRGVLWRERPQRIVCSIDVDGVWRESLSSMEKVKDWSGCLVHGGRYLQMKEIDCLLSWDRSWWSGRFLFRLVRVYQGSKRGSFFQSSRSIELWQSVGRGWKEMFPVVPCEMKFGCRFGIIRIKEPVTWFRVIPYENGNDSPKSVLIS